MVSLNGILDIGKVENQMMLRDRMLDGKALEADLKVDWLKWSKMLIILFHLWLDKFSYIGVVNKLKMIY